MKQNILPFKLGKTSEKITSHAGLSLFGEFLHSMHVLNQIDINLPKPGSSAGYAASKFVEPLLLMLHGGGRSIEDLREIRADTGLRNLLGISEMPSSDATGDWFRRMGKSPGIDGLGDVNEIQIRRALNKESRSEYTLDIDATQIVAEKEGAQKTYKGEMGYMPMVGHLAENGLIIGDEFRDGNESPSSRNLEFIKDCASKMPKGTRIANVRADSAAYQARIINWCEENNIQFTIGGDKDKAVVSAIKKILDEDWRSFREGHIAETVHTMNNTFQAFRLIVIRRPMQEDMFKSGDLNYRYTVIVSNRDEAAEETVKWYNRRGDTSENRIKELKIGFGMERMPCGTIEANAVYFRIGVLAYNLFVLFKILSLPSSWKKHQVQTLRWRLYQTAGKVVSHSGCLYLKVRDHLFELFDEVRTRCREFVFA